MLTTTRVITMKMTHDELMINTKYDLNNFKIFSTYWLCIWIEGR